jgi:broad specificity phosphatase PhoE
MTTFLLIRHGNNEFLVKKKLPGQLPGIHLNENGRLQAREIGNSLNGTEIAAIFSSTLERAKETAEPLAQKKSLPINTDPGLMDPDAGKWAGRTIKSLEANSQWKEMLASPSTFRFPNGESFGEVQARVVQALERLRLLHPKRTVAVFCHGDPIKLAASYYLGLPLVNFAKLVVLPASLTILRVDEFEVRLLVLNHLPPYAILQTL